MPLSDESKRKFNLGAALSVREVNACHVAIHLTGGDTRRAADVLKRADWRLGGHSGSYYHYVMFSPNIEETVRAGKELLLNECGMTYDSSESDSGTQWHYYRAPPRPPPPPRLGEPPAAVLQLGASMYALLGADDEHDMTDFTLVSGEGAAFKVNKLVLCARSTAFATMLGNKRLVQQCPNLSNGTMPLPEAGDTALAAFVKAVYTGEYTLKYADEEEAVIELLHLADVYDLPDLKLRIEHDLLQCVKRGNALEIAKIADRYKMERLNDKIFSGLAR